MLSSLVLTIVVVIGLIWFVLDWREKKRATAGLPRHSALRLIFAAAAILTAVFSGGCGSIMMIGWIIDGMRTGGYFDWITIVFVAGPPFVIGTLIWWLSMRRGKG